MTNFEKMREMTNNDDRDALIMFLIETFNKNVWDILGKEARMQMIKSYSKWMDESWNNLYSSSTSCEE